MNLNVDIPQSVINAAMQESLFKGELGDKVAAHLANLYSEITTYNRTDAAKLLNIGRSTLHEYEKQGLIEFKSNRISAAALLQFSRKLTAGEIDGDDDSPNEVERKGKREKRRF